MKVFLDLLFLKHQLKTLIFLLILISCRDQIKRENGATEKHKSVNNLFDGTTSEVAKNKNL